MEQTQPLMEINQLNVYLNSGSSKVKLLDNISLSIGRGETVGLIGESGSGKSVTALSLMGLLPELQADGDIWFNQLNLNRLKEKEWRKIRGNDISMIFQEPMTSLNPVFTIGEQLAEPLISHKKLRKREIRERIILMLSSLGIPDAEAIIDEYPHQLSGGMRQRIVISLAMLGEPSLLIADEPTTALDVTVQAQILELIKQLKQQRQMAILLVTHDFGVVAEMCDRVIVMYAGQIVEVAPVRTLFDEPKHPYTEALLASRPQLSGRKKELVSIPGSIPRPDQRPQGCTFAPRCHKAFDQCHTESPPLYQLGEQSCRCWLYEDDDLKEVAGDDQ